jgi:hypothetical protein
MSTAHIAERANIAEIALVFDGFNTNYFDRVINDDIFSDKMSSIEFFKV